MAALKAEALYDHADFSRGRKAPRIAPLHLRSGEDAYAAPVPPNTLFLKSVAPRIERISKNAGGRIRERLRRRLTLLPDERIHLTTLVGFLYTLARPYRN